MIIDATSVDFSGSGTISQELYDQLRNAALSQKFIYIKQKGLIGSSIVPISYILQGKTFSFCYTNIYYVNFVNIVYVFIISSLEYTSNALSFIDLATKSDINSRVIKIPYSNIELNKQDSDTIKSIFGEYTTWSSLVSNYQNNINPPIVNFYNSDDVLVSSEKPIALSCSDNMLMITLMGAMNRILYGYDIVNIHVVYDSDNDSYSCELMHDFYRTND